MKEDILYHFALGTGTHDFPALFGDVKVRSFIQQAQAFFAEGENAAAFKIRLDVSAYHQLRND